MKTHFSENQKNLYFRLITIFVIFFGFYSLLNIKRESYPHVEQKIFKIYAFLPGASSQKVESAVTIPIERKLKNISGIKKYTSTSSQNFSSVDIRFDEDVKDLEGLKLKIKREIDDIDFPSEMEKKPYYWEWKITEFSVLDVSFYAKDLPYSDLRSWVKELKDEILELPDVTAVDAQGLLDIEFQMELDLEKINKNYISIDQIIEQIKVQNQDYSGGVFKNNIEDKSITIKSLKNNIEDLENIILRSTFDGNKLYLKDVASISKGYKEENFINHHNGQPAIILNIKKKAASDVIKTVSSIKKTIAAHEKIKQQSINISYTKDMSEDVKNRLQIVISNALMGLVLVVVCLFVFMQFRTAFWTAFGMIFSVAFATMLFGFFNITLNSISLLGMIVVLGIVVDDSIIISENIYRHYLMGKPWTQAAKEGVDEVAWPVIATIATTIVAFIPLYFISGEMGIWSKEIPMVVILVLVGSGIESLFFLPRHIPYQFFKKIGKETDEERRFIVYLNNKYLRLLKKCLNHYKKVIFGFFIIITITSTYFLFYMPFVAFPGDDSTTIFMEGEVLKGQNIFMTEKQLNPLERYFNSLPTNVLQTHVVQIGFNDNPKRFFIQLILPMGGAEGLTTDDFIAKIKEQTQSLTLTNVYYSKKTGGLATEKEVDIKILSDEEGNRVKITEDIIAYLTSQKGIENINRDDIKNHLEYQINLDSGRAAELGISPLAISRNLRVAFQGYNLSEEKTPDENIFYKLILDKPYRNDFSNLFKIKVLNQQGKQIPLGQLINVETISNQNNIQHYRGTRNTTVTADLNSKYISGSEFYKNLNSDFISKYSFPVGCKVIVEGAAEKSSETLQSLIVASVLALVFIFIILFLLFNSFYQSIIVTLAVPFSLIGVTLALLIHDMPKSYMALFGIIGLGGVVVNDSLVLVDYINQLSKNNTNNSSIIDRILEASKVRFRAIILTSITTILGLLPTAYGIGGRDNLIIPTTIVMSWGLLFSTILILFLIPCFYLLGHRLRIIKD